MIRIFLCLTLMLASGVPVAAATLTRYVNSSPLNSPPQPAPQIDATEFVNLSIFNVTTSSGLPYQTLNTLFFENRGQMTLTPGYRFDFFTNNLRLGMNSWQNSGAITGTTLVLVSATNIVNGGSIYSGPQGLIRLNGKNVDLRLGKFRTGQSDAFIFGGGATFGSNYTSAAGVTDIYWGTGTNNHLDNNGMVMRLTGGFGFDNLNYTPPILISPFHQVIDSRFFTTFTNLVSVGGFNYGAFAHRAQTGPSNFIVQVVFAPTNNFDTNFTTDVRFYTNFGSGVAIPVVRFKAIDFDIVTLRQNTNSIYLVDNAAVLTNYFLARPTFGGGTGRRPNVYDLYRSEPFEFFLGTNGNTAYSPDLIYNPSYQLSSVTNAYAGYAASLTSGVFTNTIGGVDPTNFTGRIEITGDSVNLDQARIRAESTVIIRTPDLAGNKVARVDAPFLNYDLGSAQPQMTISNLASASVRRLSGEIAAWTGRWKNFETTPTGVNEIDFHVLIVDNFLQSTAPVVISEFAARAPHVEINDVLSVRKSFAIEATDLNITGGLTLPFDAEWDETTVIGLLNFTNSGNINILQSGFFGAEPAEPYQTFVNSGNISASSLFVDVLDFQNSGCLFANGGALSLQADTAVLHGKPTILFTNVVTNFFGQVVTNILTNSLGPKLAADAEIDFQARTISLSNAIFHALGGISLTATESIVDSGQGAINRWTTHGGIEILTLPTVSDLLGTHVISVADSSEEVSHIWSGADFKATALGFSNNLALGKLTLDGGTFSLFRFASPTGARCALYVDYLEFVNNATNYTTGLQIDESLTVYFANANISPSKLDGRHNGHLRWVKTFAGPLSSTNITYPSGRTYTFNIGLVEDNDLDSDGDGIVNGQDPTPIYSEEHIDLRAVPSKSDPSQVALSWYTLQNSVNRLEYRTSLQSGSWQSLTNFAHSAASGRVTVQVPSAGVTRFYRVRVEPPPLN